MQLSRLLVAASCALLLACPVSAPTTLTDIVSATTAECPAGGRKILSGLDLDSDGTLSATEATRSAVVCNGAPGAAGGAGPSALVVTTPEAAGPNCPAGGTKLEVGIDDDADGTLAAGEVDSTRYLCNGTGGAGGNRTLIAVSAEAAGANCVAGGQKLQSGVDDNGDGTLQAGEVDATSYVCNPARALVAVTPEPAGANCAQGGSRVDSGLDTNGDNVLGVAERTATSYVCNGAGGGSGTLLRTLPEPAGANCALGGVRLDSGADTNGNGTLEAGEVLSTAYVCASGVPFRIVTATVPGVAGVGAPYSATLEAAGGTAGGYQWAVASGALPPGLALGATGTPSTTLSGVPSTPGTYAFTIRVTDFFGQAVTQAYSIVVSESLAITSFVFPRVRSSVAYSASFTASGGVTPYTWALVPGVGTLPAGLALSPSGVLSGTPTSRLGASFTVEVTDSAAVGATARVRVVLGGDQQVTAFTGDLVVDGVQQVFVNTIAGAVPGTPVQVSNNVTGALGFVITPLTFSPDGRYLAYRADYDADGVTELYLVDVSATPGAQLKVNTALPTGSDVADFKFSPDGRSLVYRADQDVDNDDELFFVDLSGAAPAAPVQLNAPLVASGDVVGNYEFSPDSAKLAYVADQDIDGIYELFIATLSATPTRVKLSMPTAGDVCSANATTFCTASQLQWLPDSERLLFRADAVTDEVFELFVTATTGTPASVNVSGAMNPAGDVLSTDWALGPLGDRVAFIADKDTDTLDQLYAVALTGAAPGPSVRVSSSTANVLLDVASFAWSPDGKRLGYQGDLDVDAVDELYVVDASAALPLPLKLNPALVSGGDVIVGSYQWLPTGRGLVFRADATTDAVNELFLGLVATAGTAVRLNQALPSASDVDSFAVSENGQSVAFLADAVVDSDVNLYLVDLAGATPTVPAQVNGPLSAGADVISGFSFRGDSAALLYRSSEAASATTELFLTGFTGASPGTPARVSPIIVAGGTVTGFVTQP